jgi:hypothetical protein
VLVGSGWHSIRVVSCAGSTVELFLYQARLEV